MTQPNSQSAQNAFNISNGAATNLTGSKAISSQESATELSTETPEENTVPRKVILFLAANPHSSQPLRLDEEIREIEAELRRSKHRDRFDLKQRWAVRTRDLMRSLLDCQPHIVHFSGHGTGQSTYSQSNRSQSNPSQSIENSRKASFVGDITTEKIRPYAPIEEGLILEDQIGQPKLVKTEALSALFKLFTESVECVLLNACYSEKQAQAIAQHIPYVVGMNQAIGDRAAIEFAVGFYEAIGAGESIETAYALGCVAIQMAGISEHLTPQLISNI